MKAAISYITMATVGFFAAGINVIYLLIFFPIIKTGTLITVLVLLFASLYTLFINVYKLFKS